MERQLSLFDMNPVSRKHGNPYRDMDGKYCTMERWKSIEKDMEIKKLMQNVEYYKLQSEMYERMVLALHKRMKY